MSIITDVEQARPSVHTSMILEIPAILHDPMAWMAGTFQDQCQVGQTVERAVVTSTAYRLWTFAICQEQQKVGIKCINIAFTDQVFRWPLI